MPPPHILACIDCGRADQTLFAQGFCHRCLTEREEAEDRLLVASLPRCACGEMVYCENHEFRCFVCDQVVHVSLWKTYFFWHVPRQRSRKGFGVVLAEFVAIVIFGGFILWAAGMLAAGVLLAIFHAASSMFR